MKYILIILLFFSANVYGQTTEEQLEIANQRLFKSLEVLDQRDKEIVALNDKIGKLEQLQETPCSVAIRTVNNDIIFWHLKLEEASDKTRKEVRKTLASKRKYGEKSIRSQCNLGEKKNLFTYIKEYAPLAILIYGVSR